MVKNIKNGILTTNNEYSYIDCSCMQCKTRHSRGGTCTILHPAEWVLLVVFDINLFLKLSEGFFDSTDRLEIEFCVSMSYYHDFRSREMLIH